MLGLTLGVRNVLYNTHAVLRGTTQPFPDELWDVRFGVLYDENPEPITAVSPLLPDSDRDPPSRPTF